MNSAGARPGLRAVLAALFGLACAVPAAAQTDRYTPQQAQESWVRYADAVRDGVVTWLGDASPTAIRLRTYLDSVRPAVDQPSPPLEIKFWIDAEGVITRVAFQPFPQPAPNDDVQMLLVGRRLPTPPPADMPLPLRLAVQLEPDDAPNPMPGGV